MRNYKGKSQFEDLVHSCGLPKSLCERFYRSGPAIGYHWRLFDHSVDGTIVSGGCLEWSPILHCDWLISLYSAAENPKCPGKQLSHGMSLSSSFLYLLVVPRIDSTSQNNFWTAISRIGFWQCISCWKHNQNGDNSTCELQSKILKNLPRRSSWKSQECSRYHQSRGS